MLSRQIDRTFPSDPLLQFIGRVPFGIILKLASWCKPVLEEESGYPVAAIGQNYVGAFFLRFALRFTEKPRADTLPAIPFLYPDTVDKGSVVFVNPANHSSNQISVRIDELFAERDIFVLVRHYLLTKLTEPLVDDPGVLFGAGLDLIMFCSGVVCRDVVWYIFVQSFR